MCGVCVCVCLCVVCMCMCVYVYVCVCACTSAWVCTCGVLAHVNVFFEMRGLCVLGGGFICLVVRINGRKK